MPRAADPSRQAWRGTGKHVRRMPPTTISPGDAEASRIPLEQLFTPSPYPRGSVPVAGPGAFNLPAACEPWPLPAGSTCCPGSRQAPPAVWWWSPLLPRRGRLDFTRLDPVVGWRQELQAYADSKLAKRVVRQGACHSA